MEALDIWIEQEHPADSLRRTATAWILTRLEDPYQGMRRSQEFPNLWFGPIPRTSDGVTTAVCSYWIEEQRRTVRCDSFATLDLPI